jgi:SET domain-containing protein
MNTSIENENVTFKGSLIHGTGGFAARTIPRGTRVIEYVGEKITKAESLQRCEANNEYIFTLDEESDLDGSVPWNPARFINHSCTPNCEAVLEAGHIWVIALRDIAPGEELSFNYGYDLTDYREHPCSCGTAKCVGFMVAEEFFSHLERQREMSRAV